MKMNKKGFTLIEMLVVIAIIAILVAIVIPVVGSSTTKAQAATDAANLRSAQATLQIAVLNGTIAKPTAKTEYSKTDFTTNIPGSSAPVSKTDKNAEFKYTVDQNGNVTVYFGTAANNIDYYAGIAGNS